MTREAPLVKFGSIECIEKFDTADCLWKVEDDEIGCSFYDSVDCKIDVGRLKKGRW